MVNILGREGQLWGTRQAERLKRNMGGGGGGGGWNDDDNNKKPLKKFF